MNKILVVFGLAILLTSCTDQSRHFVINNDDCDGSLILLDLDTLVEKTNNQEEATNKPDISPELSIPATSL